MVNLLLSSGSSSTPNRALALVDVPYLLCQLLSALHVDRVYYVFEDFERIE